MIGVMPDTRGRGTAEDLPLRRAAAPEGARGQMTGRSKWRAGCIERCLSGVRREARCDIPAGGRRNRGYIPGLLAYLEAKAEGDKACRASDACPKAL